MGNYCGKEKPGGFKPPDKPFVVIEDSMFKEYINGKHDIVDKMKIQGDSFIIPKHTNIEIIDLDDIGDIKIDNIVPISDSNSTNMPDLISMTSSWEEHNYDDSGSFFVGDSVSTYGTRSSPDRDQRNPSFASCLCDPSHSNKDQDSDAMSSYSEVPRVIYPETRSKRSTQTVKDVEKNKFTFTNTTPVSTPVSRVGRRTTWKRKPSESSFQSFQSFQNFDKKNWLWRSLDKPNRNKSAKIGPGRGLPMTPMVSDVPPPFFSRL